MIPSLHQLAGLVVVVVVQSHSFIRSKLDVVVQSHSFIRSKLDAPLWYTAVYDALFCTGSRRM